MYIGEIASRTGSSPKAIRHYESLGLLGRVHRAGVYRVYSAQDVAHVQLIKQAQALGFRLADLQPFLQGHATGPDWAGLCDLVRHKRLDVRDEILRLQHLDLQLGLVDNEIRACLASDLSAAAPAVCDMPSPGTLRTAA